MRRTVDLLLPLGIGVLLLALGSGSYARLLAGASDASRTWLPAPSPPSAVQRDGAVLVVRSAAGAARIHVGAVAWNLPVLLCLWAWLIRGRWMRFAAFALGLVAIHAVVVDVQVRAALGGAAGAPYALARAWIHWLGALVVAAAVATGHACGVRRARVGT